MNDVGGISREVDIYMVLDWPHNILLLIEHLGFWARDCNFKRRKQTAPRPVFALWHKVKMFAAFLSGRGSLYA